MRRFILIAAMLLISASARADGPRSLSLASNDGSVAAELATATEAPKVQSPQAGAPTIVEQPSDASQPPIANQAKPDQAKPDQAKSDQAKSDHVRSGQIRSASNRAGRPRLRRSPLETRVVDELHRHGIYW